MNWQTTADGHRCTRHDETFRRGEVCQACVVDPGAVDDEADEVDAAERDLAVRESEFRSLAKHLFRRARELLDGENEREANAGTKLIAEGVKLERLALEVYDRRATKRDVSDLLKKYRELLALDGPH